MKIILTLFLCSFTTGTCFTPYQWPDSFNNYYDCLNFGYAQALKKSKELGKDVVEKNGYYIRFACIEKIETDT